MSKDQIVSLMLLVIFLFLNFSIMKSWSRGITPVAVSEEIQEANGGEEETDCQSFHLDFIYTTNTGSESTQTLKITNRNYHALHDTKGTFFVPNFYSPPDYI